MELIGWVGGAQLFEVKDEEKENVKKSVVPKNRHRKRVFKNQTFLIRAILFSDFTFFWCQTELLDWTKKKGQNIDPCQSYG